VKAPRKRAPRKRARATGPEEPPLVIRRSSIHDRGAFATRRIAPGELVIEYEGERISWNEADRRYPDDDDDGPTHTVLFEIDSKTVIDGGAGGNDARFINHSCRPNCEAVDERRRIMIRAMRRIREGEELTYDYALTRDPELGAAEDARYPCRCGAKGCRGTILAPSRPRARRRRKRRA
jgi:uncharacterized protein